MLQDDIKNFQCAGFTHATVEICEKPLLSSLRVVERTHINELTEANITAITAEYTDPTYMGSGYDDTGYPVFTFAVK